MLLEPGAGSLAQSSDRVLERLSDELSPHASPETHAAVIELSDGRPPDVDGVVASWRRCAAGSRPSWARWDYRSPRRAPIR